MKPSSLFTTAALGAVALAGTAGIASASTARGHKQAPADAVFVQTDNLSANAVAVYQRAADGRLYGQRLYRTGGKGGKLGGSQVDHLASQGSLAYDASAKLLFAVNAGSDTITVFKVDGTKLTRSQVISSGGQFPASVTVHGKLVYVLNALGGGNVHGYRISGAKLQAIPGSTRTLGLNPAATPQFTTTPGQVRFSPSGAQLLVTTKDNTNNVDVYSVAANGKLGQAPTVTSLPGDVPFALAFTGNDQVDLAEAGPNAVESFRLASDGALTPIDTLDTGGTATCWILADHGSLFAGNAGSATESEISDAAGRLTLTGGANTDAGTVDATTADGGRYVYVQTGAAGVVDEFTVTTSGTLRKLGTVDVPGAAGGEGIASS